MCNLQSYINDLNEKLAKVSKERDSLKAELDRMGKITRCGDCGHFIPKIWDCDLYTGAHNPDGYCDAGEK